MAFGNGREKAIILGGILGIGAISLGITLGVYNVRLSNSNKAEERKITEIDFDERLTDAQKIVAQNIINELNELEEKSKKKVSGENGTERVLKKEVNNDNINLKNEENGIAISNKNTAAMENKVEEENVDKLEIREVVETIAKVNEKIEFIKPIDSNKFGMVFADERLVYSQTLEEWVTHKGIDFLAPIGTNVIASESGIIKEMYDDSKYGFTIVIKHDENYTSKCSGIEKNNFVKIGQKVKKGEVISKIAEASGFEKEEGSHLHYELLKNGINIEPRFN